MKQKDEIIIHFSDYFSVSADVLEDVGAFNISLINDIPLFIDPFLLFNSKYPTYKQLHDNIIKYLRFLRQKSVAGMVNDGLLSLWYTFPEVRQTWFGFSQAGNKGSGLGMDFARALNRNLNTIFSNFGNEKVTRGSHLEKLCLIREGVGRDNISDFTTNLIKEFLLEYTQSFAGEHLRPEFRRQFTIEKVRFNYDTESWESDSFELPHYDGDYVLLSPKNILTRDDIWINKDDIIRDFEMIAVALPNEQLRAQVNNYFLKMLPEKPTAKDKRSAISTTLLAFPQLIEYYIRYKEDNGDEAKTISEERVFETEQIFVELARQLSNNLLQSTNFYAVPGNTIIEARARVDYLKDFVEYKGGFRLFYFDGQPIKRESDLQLLFRLTWFGTPSDVSQEANNGRGPADFKISRGAFDKTIVEFKLASNPQLKRNLANQVEIYKRASDAGNSLKVILFFSKEEREHVQNILDELDLRNHKDIVLIDARDDNKPSASKAFSVELED